VALDLLLARIARRARDPARCIDPDVPSGPQRGARPPLDAKALAKAEARLGEPLAPFLRALYGGIGNGGFGPAYGLLGLIGGARDEAGHDALTLYERNRAKLAEDPLWRWPQRVLPLVHLGCGMFYCADATDDDAPAIWFEPNPHLDGAPWDDAFFTVDVTVRELLDSWARGNGDGDLMKRAWMSRHPGEPWGDD
jgi:hypothetical protein